jgi:hypothetical protein
MIGIDDLIAYVEIAADHEGTPTRAGQMKNCTSQIIPEIRDKRQCIESSGKSTLWE